MVSTAINSGWTHSSLAFFSPLLFFPMSLSLSLLLFFPPTFSPSLSLSFSLSSFTFSKFSLAVTPSSKIRLRSTQFSKSFLLIYLLIAIPWYSGQLNSHTALLSGEVWGGTVQEVFSYLKLKSKSWAGQPVFDRAVAKQPPVLAKVLPDSSSC